MKMLLVLMALMLGACSANVSPEKWGAAINACKANGGLNYIIVHGSGNNTEIYCNNGFSREMRYTYVTNQENFNKKLIYK